MGAFFRLFIVCSLGGTLLAHTELDWLENQSMLHQATTISKEFSAKKLQWRSSYSAPKPLEVIDRAENWFTSYASSLITPDNEPVLRFLSSASLWDAFQDIGINALHTGPMQIAGALQDRCRTASIDGGFDRISLHLDPHYGSYSDYTRMVQKAEKSGGIIIGDLVPAHSGLGADFLLALQNYKTYPGIYHMVEIPRKDWHLLPKVSSGLSVNLHPRQVEGLKKKGYIVGRLESSIFFQKGEKRSNWSTTKKIVGVDGIERRWVYLHYFKSGQPSYNWLDPSFSAQKIVSGDALFSLFILKNQVLRLDANSFLGVESVEHTKKAWSEAHPVALDATNTLAMLIRKFGGFSFQELNLGPKAIRDFSRMGADLSYDFLTRAAYINALLHQNTDLLKISYDLLKNYAIDPKILIHAMQNHDEFNYELKHLKEEASTEFLYHQATIQGSDLRKKIQQEDSALTAKNVPYNQFSGEGLCTTTVGVCASSLKIPDIYSMTEEEKEKVKKALLLLTFFNAMQPGIFAISPWDLVGALPLSKKTLQSTDSIDNDPRWILRGAVDLLHCSGKSSSSAGVPKADTLYGPISLQKKDPTSFVCQLKAILLARKTSQIAKATWLGYMPTKNPALFVLIHRLPATKSLQISAMNFSETPLEETICLPEIASTSAINQITRKGENKDFGSDAFQLHLDALEAKAVVFQKSPIPLEKNSPM